MALMISHSSSIIVTAGETLSQHSLVYCNTVDGRYYKANANTSETTTDCVGIVLQTNSVAAGDRVSIQVVPGLINNLSWSWTTGQKLYVGLSGAITTDPSGYTYTKYIGYATSATQISFDPQIYLDTSVTLSSNSNLKVASQKAIKSYTDAGLGAKAAIDHDATHISGGTDEIDGEKLNIGYVPENYTPEVTPETNSISQLGSHLKGIDAKIAEIIAAL